MINGEKAATATDFSGFRRALPERIARISGERDASRAMALAGKAGLTMTARGAGHSCHGQSLSEGGVLLENESPEPRFEILNDNLIRVESRTRWHELEAALNREDLAFPVHTLFLNLTVGGTLSVGGKGPDSFSRGAQVDLIREFRLLLPDGRALECSPSRNEELFRFAPAGLGCMGFLESFVLDIVPRRKHCSVISAGRSSLGGLLELLNEIARRREDLEHFHAWYTPGESRTEFGVYDEKGQAFDRIPEALRRAAREGANHYEHRVDQDYAFAQHELTVAGLERLPEFRVWTDYVFDFQGLTAFMNYLEPLLKRAPFSRTLPAVLILGIHRPGDAHSFPFLPARPGELVFAVGLYNYINPYEPMLLMDVHNTMDATLEKCLELGGLPYLYGYNNMDEGMKRAFYGRDYERMRELRRDLGLNDFNPGVL